MSPDRKPIGNCAICEEQTGEYILAYYRRHYRHPTTGRPIRGVLMCKRHSNKVTRYGDPYFEPDRLSERERAEIRRRYAAGHGSCRELGAEYQVSAATISRIVREKSQDSA